MVIDIANNLLANTTVALKANHLIILSECVSKPEGVFQQKILKKYSRKLTASSLSRAKSDLISLNLIQETNIFTSKRLKIVKGNKDMIKNILTYSSKLQQTLFVRPHSIVIVARIFSENLGISKAIDDLSKKYHIITSNMNNNKKIIINLDDGKIEMTKKGYMVLFHITGFIVPVNIDNVSTLREFVMSQITNKLDNMIKSVEPVFNKRRVHIEKLYSLRTAHVGLLVKSDVYNLLNIQEDAKQLGFFIDKSLKGLKEIEKSGELNDILLDVKGLVQLIFDKLKKKS